MLPFQTCKLPMPHALIQKQSPPLPLPSIHTQSNNFVKIIKQMDKQVV